MLIGIDASRANRRHKTGTEWYSYHLIRQLARIDEKNDYLLYTDRPLTGGLLDLSSENSLTGGEIIFDNKGFQILKSPNNNFKAKIVDWPFNFLWTQGGLSLEMFLRRPDALFVPAHTLPFIHPKNSFVTVHDIGFERDKRLYRRERMGPERRYWRNFFNYLILAFTGGKFASDSLDYLTWSTKFALKEARRIIVPSEFTKKEIMDFYGDDGKKIFAIHNGYDDSIFNRSVSKEAIERALSRYEIKSPYIFYVGRLERKKNISSLIEAFGIMKQRHKGIKHKLALAGRAEFGFNEAKTMIYEYGLEKEVVLPGWVEEEDMPALFAGADAFAFPSFYEGFGIPLLQAMACGTPIAASDRASIPEVVGDAALLFNPSNIEEISEAIYRLISDRALHDDLAKKGLERVKNFGWEKSARETLQAIAGKD